VSRDRVGGLVSGKILEFGIQKDCLYER
jgi:hypothetical protein